MVIQFEENRIRQQEVEVRALIALCEYGNHVQKFEALKHLEAIAYPDKLAEKINTLDSNYKKRPVRNYWGDVE